MAIKFKDSEIRALQKHPSALRALADWHSAEETKADAIGHPFEDCVKFHKARYIELRAAAQKIEDEY